jgi:hypothetical protein
MTLQEHSQFTIYDAETAIPRHQRAWVWGVVALIILFCGAVTGWLLSSLWTVDPSADPSAGSDAAAIGSTALLARQEAVNQQLRERIVKLEQALASDVCDQTTLKSPISNK